MIDLTSILNLNRIQPEYALQQAIWENKESILRLNDKQLDKGIDAKGADLGSYKNFKYKGRFKPIDLKQTGEFRGEEDIIVDDQQMLFVDPNWKTDQLMTRFGEDIVGLTDESEAAKLLTPSMIQHLENQLS